jgi:glycosyltransferase involved in cell wall biosynthesis
VKTFSVLICAFNEEKNIKNIINDILSQSVSDKLLLEDIIVVSD